MCPLSLIFFVLVVEILACKNRKDENIKGIQIFNTEVKFKDRAWNRLAGQSPGEITAKITASLHQRSEISHKIPLNPTPLKKTSNMIVMI